MYHYIINKGSENDYQKEDTGPIFETELEAHKALIDALNEAHGSKWFPNDKTWSWMEDLQHDKMVEQLIALLENKKGVKFPGQYIFRDAWVGNYIAGYAGEYHEPQPVKEPEPFKPYDMEPFAISDPFKWQSWLDNNQDFYGYACIAYAARWAHLMEQRMADGATVEEVADKASYDADTDGITGFMYGMAVGVLATTWEHGEALRRWHNHETQLGDEGDRANESGGVLNPALWRIGK